LKRVAESTPKIEVQDFDETRKLYLASVDGHVAGHVVTTPKLDGVKITDLYVAPEARKTGVASSLISEVKKRNSGKTLVLRARPYGVKGPKLEKLKEMYRKLGFEDESKAEDRMTMKVATDKSKRKFHSEHALGIGTTAALLSPLATLKPMNDLRNTRQMSAKELARKARTGDVLVSHFKGPYSAWRVLAPAIGGSPYYHSEIVGARGFIHQPEGLGTVKTQLADQHSAVLLRPRNNITAAQRKRIAVAACLLSAEPYSGKKLLATAALRLISPAVGTKAFTNRVLDGNICTTGPASVLRHSRVDPKLNAPEGYELAPDYLRSKNFKPVGRYGAGYDMGRWNRFYGPASRVALAAAAGGGIYKATKDIRKHEGLAPLGAVVGGVGGLAAGAGLERIARVGVEGLQNMRGIGRFLPSSPARRAALSKFFNTISEKASLTPAAVMGLLGGVGGYLFAKSLYRGRDKRRKAKAEAEAKAKAKAKAKNQPVTKAAELAEVSPDLKRFGDVTKLPKAKALRFVIQKHLAERSGTHYDARIGNPELGLLSWATKKEWPGPGGKIMLFQQPVHPYAYGDFQGTLRGGYGKGEVRTHSKGDVTVTAAEPGKLSFTVTRGGVPEQYTMIRRTGSPKSPQSARQARTQGGSWLLVNHTPAEKLAMLEKLAGKASLFRALVTRLRPVVTAARTRGGFLPAEAAQMREGMGQFITQRMARRGLPVQTSSPYQDILKGTVQTAKGPLEFSERLPLSEFKGQVPWLEAEHKLLSGGQGSGVGSKLVRNMNRFYNATGFDAARTQSAWGSHKLWGRPQFGNQATLKGIKSMRPYAPTAKPGEELEGQTFFRIFNPQMRANLSAGKPVMEGLKQGSLIGEVKRRVVHVD
jgi:GNAT superfamily N-acetyltransferase